MGWGPICRPLLIIFWLPRVVYAVDAFLALAFAEGTFATIALAIAFALPSGLAVALSAILSFAFARLLVLASALASAMGCAVPFAFAIRANLSTRLATHAGWGRAQSLWMATAQAIVAFKGRTLA